MAFSYSEITSRKNEKIIWASKLSEKKFRDKEGIFFVEGAKLLEEVILSKHIVEKIFFTAKAYNSYRELLEKSKAEDCYLVTDEVFE